MLQHVDGKDVYVVDFDTMPQLPIGWDKAEDKPYALALDHAIRNGVITEPGKYGIHIPQLHSLFHGPDKYDIFIIQQ